MPVIYVKLSSTNSGIGADIAGFNSFFAADQGTGLLSSDLLDENGVSTGITLSEGASPFNAALQSTGNADQSPDARLPVEFFQCLFYGGATGERFVLGGFDPGTSYTLEISGQTGSGRATGYSATNSSPASVTYTPGGGDPIIAAQPVVLTGTADGSGNISVSAEVLDGFAYCNGWILTYSSGPTITDINTNNEVVPGTTATITGTNLTNTTGVTIGGVAQTAVTAVSATSVTFTVVRGGNPYNQNLTATLTSSDGTANITVQQVPEAGTFAVTAASPNTTDDASLWTGLVDTATSNPITIVNGDQAWVKNPNNLTNLAVQPDGTITADQTGDFVVQIRLASEGVWGGDQTVSFTLPDTVGPTVSTVNVPAAATYGAGATLNFTVNWNEAATVTGTPRLPITLASGTVYATYVSGTGTTGLVFSYTVQEGDNDPDGITLGAIEPNGGSIQDASTNNATLTLGGVESTAGVIVEAPLPDQFPFGLSIRYTAIKTWTWGNRHPKTGRPVRMFK